MPRVSLDASILVYGVDAADPVRHRAAKRVLRLVAQHDCVLVLQALAEFYYVVTRKAKLETSNAKLQIRELRSVFPLVLPGPTTLDAAIDLAARYRINFWDAMLIAVVKQADVALLFTEDLQDGQDYAGVRCVNPLERSAAALKALVRN
jgi:predicted nucleic acid-binding protein